MWDTVLYQKLPIRCIHWLLQREVKINKMSAISIIIFIFGSKTKKKHLRLMKQSHCFVRFGELTNSCSHRFCFYCVRRTSFELWQTVLTLRLIGLSDTLLCFTSPAALLVSHLSVALLSTPVLLPSLSLSCPAHKKGLQASTYAHSNLIKSLFL